jgi:hypothetical protein
MINPYCKVHPIQLKKDKIVQGDPQIQKRLSNILFRVKSP